MNKNGQFPTLQLNDNKENFRILAFNDAQDLFNFESLDQKMSKTFAKKSIFVEKVQYYPLEIFYRTLTSTIIHYWPETIYSVTRFAKKAK